MKEHERGHVRLRPVKHSATNPSVRPSRIPKRLKLAQRLDLDCFLDGVSVAAVEAAAATGA
jgi:hypothetical protein